MFSEMPKTTVYVAYLRMLFLNMPILPCKFTIC